MKFKVVFLAFFGIAVFLVACSKDETPKPFVKPAASFSGNINKSDWKSVQVSGSFNSTFKTLKITGTGSNGSLIVLNLKDTAMKSYDMSTSINGSIEYYSPTGAVYTSLTNPAFCSITKVDKKNQLISGNFSFRSGSSADSVNIHINFANVSFAQVPDPYFACRVDGSDFYPGYNQVDFNPIYGYSITSYGPTDTISVNFENHTVGSHSISINKPNNSFVYLSGGVRYTSTAGEINVTSYDPVGNVITAEFNGVVIDPKTGNQRNITLGKFTGAF